VRVVIVNPYYPRFLRAHYEANPPLAEQSYDEQLASLLGECFGTFDAYSRAFRALRHEAQDVVANCEPLQLAWAREHGAARWTRQLLGVARHLRGGPARRRLLRRIAVAQIEAADPDVVYMQETWFFHPRVLDRLRARGHLVVGQIATTPPNADLLRRFDLLVSSLPHLVERFRGLGIDAEYLPLAFDRVVMERAARRRQSLDPTGARPQPVTFVGGLDSHRRVAVLERLCEHTDLSVWGYGAEAVRPSSPILPRYRGQAWGLDMYTVLGQSRITINMHRAYAEGFANALRMFEATGAGALLFTEEAPNLPELFQPGSEAIAYSGPDDLVDKIHHHLEHDAERLRIAAAGQARTLATHTYEQRIAELAGMLERRIGTRTNRAYRGGERAS
jgi:spore maturation protein CgeB